MFSIRTAVLLQDQHNIDKMERAKGATLDGAQDSSLVDRHPWLESRTFRRKRLSFLALLGLVLLQNASASSRSSSRHRHSTHPHGKRRKRRRPKESTDPHDMSSSSPYFLPVAFSDDEREEDILSALARVDLEGDEEDEQEQHSPSHVERNEQRPAAKDRPSVERKETKRKVVVVPPHDKQDEGQALDADAATKDKTVAESARMPIKEIPGVPIVQPSLTALETIQQTPLRQNLVQTSLERPWYTADPKQAWTSPSPVQQQHQQQTVTSPHDTPPERRTMVASGVTTPQPAYPSPNGFARPSRQDVNLSTTRWVRKFLASRAKDTLLPIPREYLSDGFNLVQLAPIVERIGRMENGYVPPSVQNESYPLFKAALRLILQQDGEQSSTSPTVQRAAEVLYTLVHARYAISPRGLDTVRRVLRRSDGNVNPVFGRCPRIRCRGMPLLPCGDSDNYNPRNSVTTRAKRYCPCCGEVRYV